MATGPAILLRSAPFPGRPKPSAARRAAHFAANLALVAILVAGGAAAAIAALLAMLAAAPLAAAFLIVRLWWLEDAPERRTRQVRARVRRRARALGLRVLASSPR